MDNDAPEYRPPPPWPDRGAASLNQNIADASAGRATSVRGLMQRNHESGETADHSQDHRPCDSLSDEELAAERKASEPGTARHEELAGELELRDLGD